MGTLAILATEVAGERPGALAAPTFGPAFELCAGLASGKPGASSRCLRRRAMTFES